MRDKIAEIINPSVVTGTSWEEYAYKCADAILALEVGGKTVKALRCEGFNDDTKCNQNVNGDCPSRCLMPAKPATIGDLIGQ
jgi:hypothetical protein